MTAFTVDSSPSNMPLVRAAQTLWEHFAQPKSEIPSNISRVLDLQRPSYLPFSLSYGVDAVQSHRNALAARWSTGCWPLITLAAVRREIHRAIVRRTSEENRSACNNNSRCSRKHTSETSIKRISSTPCVGCHDSLSFSFLLSLCLHARARTERYRCSRASDSPSTIRENETIRNVPRRVSGKGACYFLENGPSTGYIGNWTTQRSLISSQDRRDTIVHVRGMENEIVCCTLFRLLLRFLQPPKNLCVCVCVILYRARMVHCRTAPRILLFPTKIEMSLGTF